MLGVLLLNMSEINTAIQQLHDQYFEGAITLCEYATRLSAYAITESCRSAWRPEGCFLCTPGEDVKSTE
jgi:hypothetical protein